MLKTPEQNFQDFFFQVCLKENRRLAEVPLTESTDKFVIQNGKLEGGIGLGIVGGIVGFALGGVPAILTGITMGFALGSSLFGGDSAKKSKKPKAPTPSKFYIIKPQDQFSQCMRDTCHLQKGLQRAQNRNKLQRQSSPPR